MEELDSFFKTLESLEEDQLFEKNVDYKKNLNYDVDLSKNATDFKLASEKISNIPIPFYPTLDPVRDLNKFINIYDEDENIYPYEERIDNENISITSLYRFDISQPTTTLDLKFDYTTGALIGYEGKEKVILRPEVSQSFQREVGHSSTFIRGDSNYSPFLPGGIDKEDDQTTEKIDNVGEDDEIKHVDDILNLFDDMIIDDIQFGIHFDDTGIPTVVRSGDLKESDLFVDENIGLDEYKVEKDSDYYREHTSQRTQEELNRISTFNKMKNIAFEDDTLLDSSSLDLAKEFAESESQNAMEQWLETHRSKSIETKRSEWVVTDRLPNIGLDFHELVPDPAIVYPFEMDDFQKEAVYRLENGECVFIAAHTSAGKTLVAEYSIALALKHMTRAIYTSPIKALSNQKYRDFKAIFKDVGIITGDIAVNPESSCLIVTTEILRSMLYNGASIIRDVEWIIFDEIHYINDYERGVVWEEVIIMIPDHVNMIFLSATVPNTFEFAEWIGRVKKRKIYVISTNRRPVPLEHYLYYDKELYKIADSHGYLSQGYQAALTASREKANKNKNKMKGFKNIASQEKGEWIKVVKLLQNRNLLPAVAFCFSRKKCFSIAESLKGYVNLTSQSEKSYINSFIHSSIKSLKGSDRDLPQVIALKELLVEGIGVHNSGLLPILKEIVEILFSKGLIKVLFATETFAMGINMPTRTVVFNSIRKHDGKDFRDLLSGEYIQMSGRAGRRGADTVGTVIIMCYDDIPEPLSLRRMITGKATLLESRFKLTYNMILNLFKLGTSFRVEDMIRKSFYESSNQKDILKLKKRLRIAKEKLLHLEQQCTDEGVPEEAYKYHELLEEEKEHKAKINKWIVNSSYNKNCMDTGRVVVVNTPKLKYALGVVIRPIGKVPFDKSLMNVPNLSRYIRVLALTGKMSNKISDQYDLITENVGEGFISLITEESIKLVPDNIDSTNDMRYVRNVIKNLETIQMKYSPNLPPPLDPIKQFKIKDATLKGMYLKMNEVKQEYSRMEFHQNPKKDHYLSLINKKHSLEKQIEAIEFLLSDENLYMLPDYDMRVNVLQRLGYINKDKVVKIKGKVARELNNCDELLATEIMFENVLVDLLPEEVAALLSCLVTEGKSEIQPALTPQLAESYNKILSIATGLANLQIEYGIKTTPTEYIEENINNALINVVYQWAKQKPFKEIMKLTDIPEGIVVRTIIRLDETLRDFRKAAKIIGDIELAQKMVESSLLIKRDVIFVSSLYITEGIKIQRELEKEEKAVEVEEEIEEDDEDIYTFED